MWSPLALLFYFAVTSVFSKFIKPNNNIGIVGSVGNQTNARMVGDYILTTNDQTEYDQLKFIAYIKEISGDTQIGNGIIINAYWVLTVTSVVSPYTFNQIMVVICANPAQIQGILKAVKGIVNNSQCSTKPLEACVSLIRVCPSISGDHFATIAPSLSGYRDNTRSMRLYRHQFDSNSNGIVMLRGTKNIGELCECMDLANWNYDKHVCLAEDLLTYAETSDMDSIVVTNADRSEVIGFLIVKQVHAFGEIVLYVEAVRQFITDNALVAPYQY